MVLDVQRISELKFRLEQTEGLMEQLFTLMMPADERCVVAIHAVGERADYAAG